MRHDRRPRCGRRQLANHAPSAHARRHCPRSSRRRVAIRVPGATCRDTPEGPPQAREGRPTVWARTEGSGAVRADWRQGGVLAPCPTAGGLPTVRPCRPTGRSAPGALRPRRGEEPRTTGVRRQGTPARGARVCRPAGRFVNSSERSLASRRVTVSERRHVVPPAPIALYADRISGKIPQESRYRLEGRCRRRA
jgi:hypothetical protein